MKNPIKYRFAGILAAGAALLLGLQSAWGQIKVACVGDSITAGYALQNPGSDSYPSQLQALLGSGYTVENYGASGATVLKQSDNSIWSSTWSSWAYTNSMTSNPDIVVIMLGTNDSKSWNWNATNFAADYHELIDQYQALPTQPEVFICLSPPVFTPNDFGTTFDPAFVQNTLIPAIQTVAANTGVTLIDNNTPLLNQPELFSDGVHPTAQGASVIAATVAYALTGVVIEHTLTAIGSAAPNPGPDDIFQLSTTGNTAWPDGLNYFNDNNPPAGQTFTTGTNAMKLASVAIKTAGLNSGNGYGTPASTPTYYLRIYSMSGGTATLLNTFSAPNPGFTDGDWLQWNGLNVPLAASQTYAFSFGIKPSGGGWAAMAVATNAYAGGEIALIPITGGTITTGDSHSYDAVFSLGLQLPFAAPQNVTATSGSSQIALSWSAVAGATDYTIQRSDSIGGTYTDLATGISGTTYVNTSLADGATWYYTIAAHGLPGTGTASSPVSATTYSTVENWRFANFGTTSNSANAANSADPDGDGWTNEQEYISGTDPNDRASLLKIDQMQVSGSNMLVSFPTVVGKTYRVDRSDTLQTGSWTAVQENITGNGSTMQVTDTGGSGQDKRFYRIVVGW